MVCISNCFKLTDLFFFSLEEKTIESTADAKIYNEITTIIPPESLSIPLILHGILEQVCLIIKIFFLINKRKFLG